MKYKLKRTRKFKNWFYNFLIPATLKNTSFWIFIFVFILISSIILILKNRVVDNFWSGVLVEATGFLFDIFLFGIIFSLYDFITSKKNIIRSYFNEIMFLQNWKTEEGKYKILGNIKLLNQLKVYKIDLKYYDLSGIKIEQLKIKNSELYWVNFENSELNDIEFENVQLPYVKFKNTRINNCSFIKTELFMPNLKGVSFYNVKVDSLDWLDKNLGTHQNEIDEIKNSYSITKNVVDKKTVYIINSNTNFSDLQRIKSDEFEKTKNEEDKKKTLQTLNNLNDTELIQFIETEEIDFEYTISFFEEKLIKTESRYLFYLIFNLLIKRNNNRVKKIISERFNFWNTFEWEHHFWLLINKSKIEINTPTYLKLKNGKKEYDYNKFIDLNKSLINNQTYCSVNGKPSKLTEGKIIKDHIITHLEMRNFENENYAVIIKTTHNSV